MPNLGGPEILIVLVIILIIFGAGKLPEVLGQLGKGVHEFRRSSSGEAEKEAPKPSETKTN